MILLGVHTADQEADLRYLAENCPSADFEDEAGKMNLSA